MGSIVPPKCGDETGYPTRPYDAAKRTEFVVFQMFKVCVCVPPDLGKCFNLTFII